MADEALEYLSRENSSNSFEQMSDTHKLQEFNKKRTFCC